jgi:hypothetical protein
VGLSPDGMTLRRKRFLHFQGWDGHGVVPEEYQLD